MPRICIIVPTYSPNSSSIVDELINELNKQTIRQCDLVIVNNNTSTLSLSRKFEKGSLQVLNGKKNLWSAGGFYLWMKYARGQEYDFYILWDDDAKLLDTDLLEALVEKAEEDHASTFRPYWKEKSTKECTPASISCYWCLSKETLDKCWYYDPLFFYGGEDSAYGSMMEYHKISTQQIARYFSHPVKPWLTHSRWSSGLSTFHFNYILQLYWTIYHIGNHKKRVRSLLLIFVQLTYVIYWILSFEKYFKVRLWHNIRNLILYVPQILFWKSDNSNNWWILYGDPQEDSVSCNYKRTEVDMLTANSNLVKTPNIVIDHWFPKITNDNFAFLKHAILRALNFWFLHEEKDDEISVKWFLGFRNNYTKLVITLLFLAISPLVITVSLTLGLALLVKYFILIYILRLKEPDYFSYFTDSLKSTC